MPSSLIFAGLVVIWLLILVPAVARHRQEVARPSVAALAGRVLERPPPRRRTQEVDVDNEVEETTPVPTGAPDDHGRREPVDRAAGPRPVEYSDIVDDPEAEDDPGHEQHGGMDPGDRRREPPPPRYRPGRGGFDPEAAALAARARYAFRQRVVLLMLVAAVGTAVTAALAVPGLWWAHAAADVALVGYLSYLRRQVRMEEMIRERRAARMGGARRPGGRDDGHADDDSNSDSDERPRDTAWRTEGGPADEHDPAPGRRDSNHGEFRDNPAADSSTKEPEPEPALPRLPPEPPPALPVGTTLVELDDDDPELHDLEGPVRPDYRRAAGE